jgi:hypothetical protein
MGKNEKRAGYEEDTASALLFKVDGENTKTEDRGNT